MTHKISTYILAGLLGIILLAPQYDGWKGLTDRFATWKNGGLDVAEAQFFERCNMIKSIGETKIMKGLKK